MNQENAGSLRRYYGKYQGSVRENVDPQQQGRVKVEVPAVLGESQSSWALPCLPVAGMQAGIFAVPPLDSNVWVEFEQGDSSRPIWVGGFWGEGQAPIAALSPPPPRNGQNIVIQTSGGNLLMVSDAPSTETTGGIILKSAQGATIVINDHGIFLSNVGGAKITMLGPSVKINGDALMVT